jgi:hypothetical protein
MPRHPKSRFTSVLALGALLGLPACQDNVSPNTPRQTDQPALATAKTTSLPGERAAQLAERVNARLAAKGQKLRVVGATFFMVGKGVPDFRQLRTGTRWTDPTNLTYLIDESDLTNDVSHTAATNALVNALETWDAVPNISLNLTRVPDTHSNPDLLDNIVLDQAGNCVDITDPNWQGQFASIVIGGWLSNDYFEKCLGSSDIIAVTWWFAGGDVNHDNFADMQYVEQYYNSAFTYTTTDAVYLDFDAPFDIQSIELHESGHALGLGHFGGPNPNQPFTIKPNGRVFDPTAVMNPAYLGGEKRNPYPTDRAALRSLYARSH